jgi:hypothetical protein
MVRHASRPELANAGMWYFGARIAPRKFTYTRALDDPAFARQLAEEYVAALKGAIRACGDSAQSRPIRALGYRSSRRL